MAYMKFEKKMLGGSDFFLDFLGPDLAKILGFGALRGQFWTIEIQKKPQTFSAAQKKKPDLSLTSREISMGNFPRRFREPNGRTSRGQIFFKYLPSGSSSVRLSKSSREK